VCSPPGTTFENQITEEGPQPGKTIVGINVVLDDVEGEIVKAAEAPDGNYEQNSDLQTGLLEDEQDGGDDSHDQKEDALQFDPKGVREVLHFA
jgi:hypothetical protein